MIPYGTQNIAPEDILAVESVLKSAWLTQGPAIERFEQLVAEHCGSKYAVATCNATSALHIACLASGLKAGDALWTSPISFVASANCALYCGAHPDFVDIDPASYNLSVVALQKRLDAAARNNCLPKILVPVHFAGQSCAMAEIAELAQSYKVAVIEDASHAIGGKYRGWPIGACAYSDMTIFSFHPVKIITSGEGGMILTNREDLYERLVRLRSHGITRDATLMESESEGPWYYQQLELGFNYRMTDIQAALGASQMQRLDTMIARRQDLFEQYSGLLEGLPITLPWQSPGTVSANHLYVIRLRSDKLTKTRRQVVEEMRAKGIGVNVHYIPIHMQPYYRRLGFNAGDFPVAEQYYQEAITLPLYFGMTDSDQARVATTLRQVLQ